MPGLVLRDLTIPCQNLLATSQQRGVEGPQIHNGELIPASGESVTQVSHSPDVLNVLLHIVLDHQPFILYWI